MRSSFRPKRFWPGDCPNLPILLLVGVPLLLGGFGCGSVKYEERLSASADYYRYLEEMNRYLKPRAWTGTAISMRLPDQMKELPAPPPPPEPEEGDGPPPELPPDPRHPQYLPFILPGLDAAFEAQLDLPRTSEGTNSVSEENPQPTSAGRITVHVYSNARAALNKEAIYDDDGVPYPPEQFNELLLSGVFQGVRGAEPAVTDVREELLPPMAEAKYTEPVEYDVAQLDIPPERMPSSEAGVLRVYQVGEGEVRVTILVAYPASISPDATVMEGLRKMLSTVELDGKIPNPDAKPTGDSSTGF